MPPAMRRSTISPVRAGVRCILTAVSVRPVAVLDANVCFRSECGTPCCASTHTGLFQARWTERILDEWTRNLLDRQPHLERSVRPQRRAMAEHFADARVAGYERLGRAFGFPDAGDRHVLAGAIGCGTRYIVIDNPADFPEEALARFDIEAIAADESLSQMVQLHPAEALRSQFYGDDCTFVTNFDITLSTNGQKGAERVLLRFAVENHRSIRERQELSFAASTLKDRADGLLPCGAVKSRAVVPAAVIYGANASGKTNLVNAVETMKRLVLWSHINGGPGGRIPRHRFGLDPDWSEKPSCFEIDFTLEGIRYHYGFEATDRTFTSEWLYESPRAHSKRLFEREGQKFAFGRGLKGQNQSISRLTRSNSLFLSAAAQNDHELLTRIYEYFQNLIFSGTNSISHGKLPRLIDDCELDGGAIVFENGRVDDRVVDFLNLIDTGICGVRREISLFSQRTGITHENIVSGEHTHYMVPPEFEANDAHMKEELLLAHHGKGGEKVYFKLDLESSGTRRLLLILSKIFEAIDEGVPIFVDELDLSLHTVASEAILQLFCSREINQNGAQIFATIHDTKLMQSDFLRRDQLWFAEKNKEGSTEIYPLTDFRTRKDDNIELGYRQGRYGAVPGDDTVASFLEK